METLSNVYDAVASWHTMFATGGNMKYWQAYHKNAWAITQDWMRLKDDKS